MPNGVGRHDRPDGSQTAQFVPTKRTCGVPLVTPPAPAGSAAPAASIAFAMLSTPVPSPRSGGRTNRKPWLIVHVASLPPSHRQVHSRAPVRRRALPPPPALSCDCGQENVDETYPPGYQDLTKVEEAWGRAAF